MAKLDLNNTAQAIKYHKDHIAVRVKQGFDPEEDPITVRLIRELALLEGKTPAPGVKSGNLPQANAQ